MKTLSILYFGIMLPVICSTACNAQSKEISTDCGQSVIVDRDKYETAPSDQLTINSTDIIDDCLIINFTAKGCDGSSWDIKLIDLGAIFFLYPLQRYLRLSLNNPELCGKDIEKELAFDIKPLRVRGNKVTLWITNSTQRILYEY